jgi:hypothetical protein
MFQKLLLRAVLLFELATCTQTLVLAMKLFKKNSMEKYLHHNWHFGNIHVQGTLVAAL